MDERKVWKFGDVKLEGKHSSAEIMRILKDECDFKYFDRPAAHFVWRQKVSHLLRVL